jgi:hypothetical protein
MIRSPVQPELDQLLVRLRLSRLSRTTFDFSGQVGRVGQVTLLMRDNTFYRAKFLTQNEQPPVNDRTESERKSDTKLASVRRHSDGL